MNLNAYTSRVAPFAVSVLVMYACAVIGMCLYELMAGRVPDPVQWALVFSLIFWQPIVLAGAAATVLCEVDVLGRIGS